MTGLVIFVASRARTSSPMCTDCQKWLAPATIGKLPGSANEVAERIQVGDVSGIKHIEQGQEATVFSVYRCPNCRSEDTAVLEIKSTSMQEEDKTEKSVAMFVANETKLAELVSILPESDEANRVLNSVKELGNDVRQELTASPVEEDGPEQAVAEYMKRFQSSEE